MSHQDLVCALLPVVEIIIRFRVWIERSEDGPGIGRGHHARHFQ